MIALKSTVYRTSDDTPLVPALIEASENGKQSVCLVEIKARGDERRNIEWSRALEQAGVHVVYGFPSLKIHAKTTLVVRRESGGAAPLRPSRHGQLQQRDGARRTRTSALFTADEDIAADVADLFNYLTGFGRPAHFRKLLVAPFTLRQRLIEEIRDVADAARDGAKARIRIKVNGLTHVEVIDELYAASEAGARIDLLVRGVCSLRPGVPGPEREHPRAQRARPLPRAQPRVPLRGRRPQRVLPRQRRPDAAQPRPSRRGASRRSRRSRSSRELAATLDTLLADTAASWELDADGSWQRVRPKKEERATLRPGDVDAPRAPSRLARALALATRHDRFTGSTVPPTGNLRWMTVRDRGPRCRLEHHSPARGAGRARRDRRRSTRSGCGSRSARRSSASAPSPTCTSRPRRRRFGKLCAIARGCMRVESLDVFLTAPGRQSANADELVAALHARPRRSGARPLDRGGGPARLRRARSRPPTIELPDAHRGVRRRRRVDRDRRRRPRLRAPLGASRSTSARSG